MNKKIKINTLYLIITFIVLISITPLILYPDYKAVNPSFDYYHHVTGANQIIKEQRIPYESDNRISWTFDEPLSYPPGFPILISIISVVTGIPTLQIGNYMLFWNYLIFTLLIVLFGNYAKNELNINQQVFVPLAILIGFLQITGYTSQGINFFVPTIVGSFLIMAILYFNLNRNIRSHNKIIITAFISAIIICTHRPTTMVLGLLSINLIFLFIYYKKFKDLFHYIISLILGFLIALPLFIFRLIDNGTIMRYSYGYINAVSGKIFLTVVALFFLLIVLITYYTAKPENKTRDKHNSLGFKFIKIKETLYPLIIFILILIIAMPWFFDILININSIFSLNPYSLLSNMWNLLNKSKFLNLKSILYVWHIGLLPLFFFIPGVILFTKKRLFSKIGLIGMGLIFEVYALDNIISFSDIPHRIFFFVSVIYSVVSAQAILYYWSNNQLRKTITLLLFVSIIMATTGGIIKNVPFPSQIEFQNIQFIQNSGLSNDDNTVVIAPVYYNNPMKAYGTINTKQIFNYDLDVLITRDPDKNSKFAFLIDDNLFLNGKDTRKNLNFNSDSRINKIYNVNDKHVYYFDNPKK